MRPAENIKQLIKNAKVKIDQDVKKASLDELVNELEKPKTVASAQTQPDIWRIIIKSKIRKLLILCHKNAVQIF